jgi:hypothetical protein
MRTMTLLAESAGRWLEPTGNDGPRGMTAIAHASAPFEASQTVAARLGANRGGGRKVRAPKSRMPGNARTL